MKKALVAAAVGLLLLASLPAFAQSQAYPKDAYVKTVPLVKVWVHPLGYVAQFFNSKSQVSSIYVPMTWFNKGVASKADLVYGNERGFPYAAIYWVDGKFDHITLYVMISYSHPTWGVMESVTDRTSQFSVEDVPLQF